MVTHKVPIMIQKWLKDLSLEEVIFWVNQARRKDFIMLEQFVKAEAERRKNVIWRLPENNPPVLAVEKAALRGGIEALYDLVLLAKGAQTELDRRQKEEK